MNNLCRSLFAAINYNTINWLESQLKYIQLGRESQLNVIEP